MNGPMRSRPTLSLVVLTDLGAIYAPLLLMDSLRDPQIETRCIYVRGLKQTSKWKTIKRIAAKSGYHYALRRALGLMQLRLLQYHHAHIRHADLEHQPCPPLGEVARRLSIPIKPVVNCNAPEFIAELRQDPPDLVVSAFFGQMFKGELIRTPRLGCLNTHPSLLPRHRGTNPVYWAMVDESKETGITIHQIDEGVDTGGIVAQVTVPIAPCDTHHTLYRKTVVAGSKLVEKTLRQILEHQHIESRPQPAGPWKAAPAPTPESFRVFQKLHKRFI